RRVANAHTRADDPTLLASHRGSDRMRVRNSDGIGGFVETGRCVEKAARGPCHWGSQWAQGGSQGWGGGGDGACERLNSTRSCFPSVIGCPMPIKSLDHVLLAMPAGREAEARAFYAGLLGIPEVPKPANLVGRGGCWFARGSLKVHLGVEAD